MPGFETGTASPNTEEIGHKRKESNTTRKKKQEEELRQAEKGLAMGNAFTIIG